MGIVRNQSIKNSISFYIGMAIGAINTVIIYPNVFKDNPEHFGLIQIVSFSEQWLLLQMYFYQNPKKSSTEDY